jgi:hypothetical protein
MRIKYPSLISASIGSSAPVYCLGSGLPETSYYDTVKEIYSSHYPNCTIVLEKAFQMALDLFGSNPADLSERLGLCRTPVARDLHPLWKWMTNIFTWLTEFNYPFPKSAPSIFSIFSLRSRIKF